MLNNLFKRSQTSSVQLETGGHEHVKFKIPLKLVISEFAKMFHNYCKTNMKTTEHVRTNMKMTSDCQANYSFLIKRSEVRMPDQEVTLVVDDKSLSPRSSSYPTF